MTCPNLDPADLLSSADRLIACVTGTAAWRPLFLEGLVAAGILAGVVVGIVWVLRRG